MMGKFVTFFCGLIGIGCVVLSVIHDQPTLFLVGGVNIVIAVLAGREAFLE